jgi:excisionase family DNA binding protein
MDKETVERPNKRLYTVEEAAEYLACSPWTVRELQWGGALPFVKFNRRIYFDLEDLDAFAERNKFTECP